MPSDLIVQTQEFTDGFGAKLVVFKVVRRKEENLLKDMIIAGTEIVIEAIFLAYLWKLNFNVAWTLIVSVMGIVSFLGLRKNVESYITKLPYRQSLTLMYSSWIIAGTLTYFSSIYVVSYALKRNNNIWIPFLGFASYFYHFSVSAVIGLGKTFLNRSPFTKCCQLLLGLMMIGCATCYLSFQQHEEKWVLCLPIITPAAVAYQISAAEYRRLHDLVPQPLFERYIQRVLGPMVTVYGSLVAAHVGYNIGWRSFLLLMPLISAGIYLTYQGFRKRP